MTDHEMESLSTEINNAISDVFESRTERFHAMNPSPEQRKKMMGDLADELERIALVLRVLEPLAEFTVNQ